jgi:hypothetical protein
MKEEIGRFCTKAVQLFLKQNKTNSVDFSPQANYRDRATAIFRRILVPTFVDRGVSLGQRG